MYRPHRRVPGKGAVLLVAYLVFAAAPSGAMPGDFDGDGNLDFEDIHLVMDVVAGFIEPSAEAVARADMNGDGILDIKDVTELARLIGQAPQGSHPLPFRDTISLTADRVWDVQLPGGFLITGTVVDSQGNSITDTQDGFPLAFGSINFQRSGRTASAAVADVSGNYQVILEPGSHDVTMTTVVQDLEDGTGVLRQRYGTAIGVPAVLNADADRAQNFTRPDLPDTAMLSGSITAPDVLVTNVDILSDDASAYVTVPTGNTYSLITFPMEGRVGLFGTYGGFPSGNKPSVGVRYGSVTALLEGEAKNRDLSMRLLEHVEGTIHVTDGQSAVNISANAVTPNGGTADEYFSSQSVSGNTYQLAVPAGEYDLRIRFPPRITTSSRTTWTYNERFTVPEGGGTRDFTVPELPVLVILNGRVINTNGQPIGNVNVSLGDGAVRTSPGWSVFATGRTDSSGRYSFSLPPGEYDVLLEPPFN